MHSTKMQASVRSAKSPWPGLNRPGLKIMQIFKNASFETRPVETRPVVVKLATFARTSEESPQKRFRKTKTAKYRAARHEIEHF